MLTQHTVIGSEAWSLDSTNRPAAIPDDHTKGWRVYVRNVPEGPDITTWLKKVQFKLFHTYPNNLRSEYCLFEEKHSECNHRTMRLIIV